MLVDFLLSVVQDLLGYHVGLVFLRVVTFGRYPPRDPTENAKIKTMILGWIVIAGAITLLWLSLKRGTL